ncbi:YraN family protein [Segnochrobactrum spirostomi]|uniref:UPF0102 protein F0357_11330 n=1 Tax=Segnochrobactrum spirostomi TaxID=2608987 RepID=A0A6A7Y2G4_9HYPH|nr:YraN family protein [Segnochrobactrum spirostomi]MQT13223.1 YraN family protein [Segnochrobactrum spirostomi]
MRSEPAPETRRRAYRRGLGAETLAVAWLCLKGYRILGRRFRAGAGEIDIIARKGDVVAFVEVKARRDADEALAAIDARTRRRIAAAGRVWLARHPRYAAFTLRYDVILVAGHGLRRLVPRHMISAFLDGE